MLDSLRTRLLLAILVGVMLFGFLCLNYTRGGSYEHHTAFAISHGLPQPSKPIFYAGALILAAGAATLGFVIGRSKRTN